MHELTPEQKIVEGAFNIGLPDGFFYSWDKMIYERMIDSLPDGSIMIEVGSLVGKSICSVANTIKRKNIKVICVDIFEDYVDVSGQVFPNQLDTFKSNIKSFGLENNIEIKVGKSVDMSTTVPDGSVDMVFIDADHTYKAVLDDFNAWYPKVKPGGLFSGHDFANQEVQQALDEFRGLERVGTYYGDVWSMNMWWYKPKAEPIFSVVIPTITYGLVTKCVDSIIQNTEMDTTEIVIAANGVGEELQMYVSDLRIQGHMIVLKWFDKPIGAVRAYNEGIKACRGEYIVLLNDDCVILPSFKSDWLRILVDPFSDPMVAVTGPLKSCTSFGSRESLRFSEEDYNYGFIIFFCAMIPRRIFDEIGILDESLQCAVEIDFSMRLKPKGYKIKQVPTERELSMCSPTHFEVDFPIYHVAEATVHSLYGVDTWFNIMDEDRRWLAEKYGVKDLKYSIVIPTMTYSLTKKCVESIIQNTDMRDIEIIIIANGADIELKDYLDSLSNQGIPISYKWFDNTLGAPIAYNEGIKASKGEYIVLLNDDCVILGPEGMWLNMMVEPFSDPRMGCTGPLKMDREERVSLSEEDLSYGFIIFFCAMIPRSIFDELGILDDNLKCGVDLDFCLRLRRAGYKIRQVPEGGLNDYHDPELPTISVSGNFPIIHVAESTVHDFYGFDNWQRIIQADVEILNKKYNPSEKVLPEGYFSDEDIAVYRELINSIPDNGYFVEIGSLQGRSLCSVADIIIRKNLRVVAVDLFNDFYEPLFDQHFPNQLVKFKASLVDFGIFNRVDIMVGSSTDISKLFDINVFDLVFIDADHEYQSVKDDVNNWYPKIKPGGTIAGHDFTWESVRTALTDALGLEVITTSEVSGCWYTTKPRVYDGFMFFNELDILEIRLNELYNTVTKFIIIEGTKKHSGEPNDKMYLLNSGNRFDKFKDKMVHIIVDDFPDNPENDPWKNERHLRDCIRRGWSGLNDNDVVMVSDCDEIPRASVVASYKLKDGYSSLIQSLYYDFLNNYSGTWEWLKITPYSIAKNMTPCQMRYTEAMNKIPNGGWHFTFMGGSKKIVEKMTSYAHQEYNTPEYLDRIDEALDTGIDIFKREGVTKTIIPIDDTFPRYVIDNVNNYHYKGFIRNQKEWKNFKPIEVYWPSYQKKYELYMVQEFFRDTKVERVLEIGTAFGGTAMMWAHMVEPNNGHVFCCDITFHRDGISDCGYTTNERIFYPRQVYDDSPYAKYITEFEGDSHNPEYIRKVKDAVGTVDILFIDGDHSYEGVRQDFENFYSTVKIGGAIVFHDIRGSEYHRKEGCFVDLFWDEIKDVYQTYEFIDQNWYHEKGPAESMGVGILIKDSLNMKQPSLKKTSNNITGKDILCFIPTKNRYHTTLPLALQSIISQNIKPDKLIIYDDNTEKDRQDLRWNPLYKYLFESLDIHHIQWEVIYGTGNGQHFGHQIANKSDYKFVWRVDDDEIPMPDVLEKLISHMDNDVGAVGGSIIPELWWGDASPKIADVFEKGNLQWIYGNEIHEVEHLHSSFLYRTNIVDYCLELSVVAHREETIFSHELKEKGYRLIVDQSALTHHFRQVDTGIRSKNTPDMKKLYDSDDALFLKKMESWGYKTIHLDNGIGDHYAFLNIIPKLQRKWKHLIIGCCYPEVFGECKNVTIISVASISAFNDENIYKWMWDHGWRRSLVEAFETYYGV